MTGYQVRIDSGALVDVTGTTHTFTGLNANTSYVCEVRSVDAAGNNSAWASVTVSTSAVAANPVTVVQSNSAQEVTNRTVGPLPILQTPQAGNLLVAMIGMDKDFPADSVAANFVPAGWTLAEMVNNPGDTNMTCIWRIADGTETAVNWNHTWTHSTVAYYSHVTLFAELSAQVTTMAGWSSSTPEMTSSVSQALTPTQTPKVAVAFFATDTAQQTPNWAQNWASPFELAVIRVATTTVSSGNGTAIAFATATTTAPLTATPSPIPSDGHAVAVGAWA